jgi:hypothetical protein
MFIRENELEDFLAIHIRRGDFSRYCKNMRRREKGFKYRGCWPTWKQIFSKVATVKTKYNITKVFVSTNDNTPKRLEQFSRLGWIRMPKEFPERALQQSAKVETSLSEIVLSQFIAAKSKVFIGTFHSSFSGFIRHLRKLQLRKRQISFYWSDKIV